MRLKLYPDKMPMVAMRMVAGRTADGALPKDAMPAGRESTPAPTIDFTRLNTWLDMVDVPSPMTGFGVTIGYTDVSPPTGIDEEEIILDDGRYWQEEGKDPVEVDLEHLMCVCGRRGGENADAWMGRTVHEIEVDTPGTMSIGGLRSRAAAISGKVTGGNLMF